MAPFITYLQNDEIPSNEKETHKLRIKATRFCLINNNLYRRSCDPYLKCVASTDTDYILIEIHEGSNHAGGRSLVHRVLTHGCY